MSKIATISVIEPLAIKINRLNSASDFLAEPSAILSKIEEEALHNCEASSNCSDLGKEKDNL